jgi:hypothetical protein
MSASRQHFGVRDDFENRGGRFFRIPWRQQRDRAAMVNPPPGQQTECQIGERPYTKPGIAAPEKLAGWRWPVARFFRVVA